MYRERGPKRDGILAPLGHFQDHDYGMIRREPDPLAFFFFFFKEREPAGKRGGAEEEEDSLGGLMPSVEPDTGLELMTLRS